MPSVDPVVYKAPRRAGEFVSLKHVCPGVEQGLQQVDGKGGRNIPRLSLPMYLIIKRFAESWHPKFTRGHRGSHSREKEKKGPRVHIETTSLCMPRLSKAD